MHVTSIESVFLSAYMEFDWTCSYNRMYAQVYMK